VIHRLEAAAPSRREATREAILAAALRCFARDGYRKTALDRVAREAGISRAGLYLHFDNKEQLFRALVRALHARSLTEAANAARCAGGVAERLTAMVAAKNGRFFDLLRASEHSHEFLDEHHRLCGDLSADASAKHARLLARVIAAAADSGEISLVAAALSPASAAEMVLAIADGVKERGRTTLSARVYEQRVGQTVRILIAGLAPPARGRASRGR
jgi:AcrR family transcriptional regulator